MWLLVLIWRLRSSGSGVDVDRFDLAARGHQVIHGYRLQVEKIEQDFLVLGREEMTAFQDQRAQLLETERGGLRRPPAV